MCSRLSGAQSACVSDIGYALGARSPIATLVIAMTLQDLSRSAWWAYCYQIGKPRTVLGNYPDATVFLVSILYCIGI